MHTRMRLGELLLASGLLSADQLEAALPVSYTHLTLPTT